MLSFIAPSTESDAAIQPDSFRLSDYEPERRRHGRRSVRFRAEAKRIDHTLVARRSPFFSVTVLDVSTGGIRAVTRQPVIAGERLHLTLPPESGMRRQIWGKVIRCAPRQDGWSLAIQFDAIPAA